MKTCLLAEWDDGEIGGLIDLSFVGDDHQFGPDPHGKRIHIEGPGSLAVDGIPSAVPIRRRDPAEAAERIRAGYRDAGIPEDLAEAMIEETLRGE